MNLSKETLNRIGVIGAIIVALVVLVVLIMPKEQAGGAAQADVQNNVQYVDLTAKNGYSPSVIEAKANFPTILRIKTSNTFDCSAALNIPALSYSKFLPSNGTTEVQILPQAAGTVIDGSCSMGMYGFKIKFS